MTEENEKRIIQLLEQINAKLDKIIENTHETAENIRHYSI